MAIVNREWSIIWRRLGRHNPSSSHQERNNTLFKVGLLELFYPTSANLGLSSDIREVFDARATPGLLKLVGKQIEKAQGKGLDITVSSVLFLSSTRYWFYLRGSFLSEASAVVIIFWNVLKRNMIVRALIYFASRTMIMCKFDFTFDFIAWNQSNILVEGVRLSAVEPFSKVS